MRTRKRGFTLIELLVVIAIIAILAAILFPVFGAAKQRSRTATCLGNLKQLGFAFALYADDYDGRMPNSYYWCGDTPSRPSGAFWWVYLERGTLFKYTKSANLYLCPVDKGVAPVGLDQSQCPPGKTPKDFPLSYSMNTVLHQAIPSALRFRQYTKVMLLIHEDRRQQGMNDGRFIPGGGDVPSNLHYDGTCLVYLDGHARWGSYNDLVKENTPPECLWATY